MTNALQIIDDIELDYSALGPEQQQWVKDDQVIMYPGREPGKPVIRWSASNSLGKHPGALAPGSGVSPKHMDALNAKRGALKQTSEYKALLQRILTTEDGGGFDKIVGGMITAAMGAVRRVKFQCEHCGEKNDVTIQDPPNPLAGKTLMEFVLGRAPQYTEVDITARVLATSLAELMDVKPSDFASAGFTPEEVADRQRIVEAMVVRDE